jgi:hypothetical protein
MNYLEFLADVMLKYVARTDETIRYGQVYYNYLLEVKPSIAKELNGSLLDPFHRDNCPPKVHEFVEARWTT